MPDEKRIKDFEPATNLLIDDWFAVDSPSQGTRKIQKSMFMADEIASLQTLSTAMGNAQTDIGNLQTRAGMSQNLNFGDNLTDGVNILSVLLGAEPYVNTRTYAVGEYCIYEKQLYKCTTAVTSAEDFDSDKWTLTNVKTELTELNFSLGNKANTSSLPSLSTSGDWKIIDFPNIKVRIYCATISITYPANTGNKAFSWTYPESYSFYYSISVDVSVNGRTDSKIEYARGSNAGGQAYVACGATVNTAGILYVTAFGKIA